MNILAMDTASEIFSLALAAENGTWYIEADAGSRHSELIMECADRLCGLAEIRPDEIGLAACMRGPGSFTGLRIGYAAAKGLSLALDIPMIAVPTLDCVAHTLSAWPGTVLPLIDAKKGRFFTALYRNGKRLGDCVDAPPELIAEKLKEAGLSPGEPVILTGPGAKLCAASFSGLVAPECMRLDPGFRKGRAGELLEIANSSIIMGQNGRYSGPMYLRKSDAEINRDNNNRIGEWLI